MKTTEIVFRNENGVPVTTSYLVAETFGKKHQHVLRDIDTLECSESLRASNFGLSFRIRELPNGGSKEERFYYIGKDGFTFLAMGYTGKKAAEFKEKYIAAFNAMQRTIQQAGQLSTQFMETQMQMMNQMMNLCNGMMQRLEHMEQASSPAIYRNPETSASAVRTSSPVQEQTPTVLNEGEAPVAHNGQLWNKCVMSYGELRTYYPDYKNTHDVAEELRRRGIHIYQRGLFSYLREKGYLSDGVYTFNRPSEECARNRYMVATVTGRNGRTGRHRGFVPYHSPAFIDILEKEMCEIRHHVQQPYLQFNEPGKEVQP